MDEIVTCRKLVFRYPNIPDLALNSVDFTICSGKKIALLGPNGAGKSTLFSHLNGLLKPKSGTITLYGEPVSYSRRFLKSWRRQVGTVMQNSDAQFCAVTVRDDVAYGLLNLGKKKEEALAHTERILDALGIIHLAERTVFQLSHGEKRRVAIAGVLALRPHIVLLDEPLAGLDHTARLELTNLMEHVMQEGVSSLILSTHDVDFAYSWADEVALLCDGSLEAFGPTQTVLRDLELVEQCRLSAPMKVLMEHSFESLDCSKKSTCVTSLLTNLAQSSRNFHG